MAWTPGANTAGVGTVEGEGPRTLCCLGKESNGEGRGGTCWGKEHHLRPVQKLLG